MYGDFEFKYQCSFANQKKIIQIIVNNKHLYCFIIWVLNDNTYNDFNQFFEAPKCGKSLKQQLNPALLLKGKQRAMVEIRNIDFSFVHFCLGK